eukprot:26343-Pelagococcus_subviridis.AAC.11
MGEKLLYRTHLNLPAALGPQPRGDAFQQWQLRRAVHEVNASHGARRRGVLHGVPAVRPLVHRARAAVPGLDEKRLGREQRALQTSDALRLVHEHRVVPPLRALRFVARRAAPARQRRGVHQRRVLRGDVAARAPLRAVAVERRAIARGSQHDVRLVHERGGDRRVLAGEVGVHGLLERAIRGFHFVRVRLRVHGEDFVVVHERDAALVSRDRVVGTIRPFSIVFRAIRSGRRRRFESADAEDARSVARARSRRRASRVSAERRRGRGHDVSARLRRDASRADPSVPDKISCAFSENGAVARRARCVNAPAHVPSSASIASAPTACLATRETSADVNAAAAAAASSTEGPTHFVASSAARRRNAFALALGRALGGADVAVDGAGAGVVVSAVVLVASVVGAAAAAAAPGGDGVDGSVGAVGPVAVSFATSPPSTLNDGGVASASFFAAKYSASASSAAFTSGARWWQYVSAASIAAAAAALASSYSRLLPSFDGRNPAIDFFSAAMNASGDVSSPAAAETTNAFAGGCSLSAGANRAVFASVAATCASAAATLALASFAVAASALAAAALAARSAATVFSRRTRRSSSSEDSSVAAAVAASASSAASAARARRAAAVFNAGATAP